MSTSDAKEVKGDSKQAEAKAADGQKEQEDFIILSLRSDVPPAQAVVRTPKKTTLGEFKAAASKHLGVSVSVADHDFNLVSYNRKTLAEIGVSKFSTIIAFSPSTAKAEPPSFPDLPDVAKKFSWVSAEAMQAAFVKHRGSAKRVTEVWETVAKLRELFPDKNISELADAVSNVSGSDKFTGAATALLSKAAGKS